MKSKKLAKLFKQKRMAAGYSQIEVSKKLGYASAQYVSNWERGLSVPPVRTMKILIKLYKLSVDELYKLLLEETLALETSRIKKAFGIR